jgi:lysophospholipase L1-like esterase
VDAIRQRNLGAKLALLAGSTAVCLFLAELGVRLAGTDGRAPPARRVQVLEDGMWRTVGVWGTGRVKRPGSIPETRRIGEYVPGSSFRFLYFDLDRVAQNGEASWETTAVEHHINRQGRRGPEVPTLKPSGEFRILSLGDSFTFGDGVADGETFTARLEDLLNEDAESGLHYRAINAGVSGFNTFQEVAWLKHIGPSLEPDLVLITFYINDAYEDDRFGALISGRAAGVIHPGAESSQLPLWSLRWVENTWARWRSSEQVIAVYRAQFSDKPMVGGQDWRTSRAALADARAWAEERGVRIALAIFPELHKLDDSHPFASIHARVREVSVGLGIPTLDLLPIFLGEDARALWVHVSDHHPNSRAHGMAGRAIASFLKEQGLVSPMPARESSPLDGSR